jgi:peptide-methionine (S)-S-oxide reductase
MSNSYQLATLGGGCFWCVEAVLEQLQGVEKVVSGYTGGKNPDPTYRQVCGGGTGHAEVVQITFDPAKIDFRTLLEVFFATHDPTTLNKQGADEGTQYRSAIFFHSDEQKTIAQTLIQELNQQGIFGKPIVTEVTPATIFYAAEDYHQGYYRTNPTQGYCSFVIDPKVAKLRQKFASKLKG